MLAWALCGPHVTCPAARNREPVCQEPSEHPRCARRGLAPLPPNRPRDTEGAHLGTSPNSRVREQSEPVLPGQIRALPAGITNRVGRFRRTPGAANIRFAAGIYTFTGHGPDVLDHGGLDLSASVFAPCSLGRPGTPRQHAGIHCPPWIQATAQNGWSRQVPVSNDASSERTIEQSSGLLICEHIGPVAAFPMAI